MQVGGISNFWLKLTTLTLFSAVIYAGRLPNRHGVEQPDVQANASCETLSTDLQKSLLSYQLVIHLAPFSLYLASAEPYVVLSSFAFLFPATPHLSLFSHPIPPS
jgi:hypothetical protein